MNLVKSHFESKKKRSHNPTTQHNGTNAVANIKMSDSTHTLSDGRIVHYKAIENIGNGSFGLVFKAKIEETNEIVAIKKVLQDKRYKNREIQIMKLIAHDNIVSLRHCFYSPGEYSDELYLNLVLEYIPETVYSVAKHAKSSNIPMPYIKYWIYQILKSLSYIHSLGICHRDIKPQNLLVNPETYIVKLCDFGSAKMLQPTEPNVSYICSRYYRAPELIFGATNYTTAIDIWSLGCVFAELLLGRPIFPGENGVDQLVQIIKVLGTPKKEEITAMNPNYNEYQFPQIKPHPWNKVFRYDVPNDCTDLISKMLEFNPIKRIDAITALTHPFFDELRTPNYILPKDIPLLPGTFYFSLSELLCLPLEKREILVPLHARNNKTWYANPDGSWPTKLVEEDTIQSPTTVT